MKISVFIPGNVPSSKNSKVWTGKRLVMSKTVQRYLKENQWYWSNRNVISAFKKVFNSKQRPRKVSFIFIRDSKRRFDYVNVLQLPLDLMVRYGWINDDNADEIIPVLKKYQYNKSDPGVIISVKT